MGPTSDNEISGAFRGGFANFEWKKKKSKVRPTTLQMLESDARNFHS
jgi:hypothetical protein